MTDTTTRALKYKTSTEAYHAEGVEAFLRYEAAGLLPRMARAGLSLFLAGLEDVQIPDPIPNWHPVSVCRLLAEMGIDFIEVDQAGGALELFELGYATYCVAYARAAIAANGTPEGFPSFDVRDATAVLVPALGPRAAMEISDWRSDEKIAKRDCTCPDCQREREGQNVVADDNSKPAITPTLH